MKVRCPKNIIKIKYTMNITNIKSLKKLSKNNTEIDKLKDLITIRSLLGLGFNRFDDHLLAKIIEFK